MISSERDFLFQISMVRCWVQSQRILEDCCSCCRRRPRSSSTDLLLLPLLQVRVVWLNISMATENSAPPATEEIRLLLIGAPKQANLPLQIFSLVLTYSLLVRRVQWTRQSPPRNLDILQTRRFSLANISSSSTLQWVTWTSHND